MVSQHQQDFQQQPMPKFIGPPSSQIIEEEPTAAETMNIWVWPVACWLIILMNTVIGCIAIAGMMGQAGYSPTTHFFMTGCFLMTFAALAMVYKVILRGK